ncbi:hypothetical protein [Enterococcus sp. DIV0187]|uniref:hypothetical protein n=1 Tax=Enterococcus sp. DIV0187 TaxID=2774644 RepID=UPI003F236149
MKVYVKAVLNTEDRIQYIVKAVEDNRVRGYSVSKNREFTYLRNKETTEILAAFEAINYAFWWLKGKGWTKKIKIYTDVDAIPGYFFRKSCYEVSGINAINKKFYSLKKSQRDFDSALIDYSEDIEEILKIQLAKIDRKEIEDKKKTGEPAKRVKFTEEETNKFIAELEALK